MLEQLLAALSRTRLDLTSEEIADSLWLALHIQRSAVSSPQNDTASLPISLPSASAPAPRIFHSPSTPHFSEPQKDPKIEPNTDRPAHLYVDPNGSSTSRSEEVELPFDTPEAPGLIGRLALARSLRPMMRRVPSRIELTLDEETTATQIAETDLWHPVSRPRQERWLDVALVVDGASSLRIWHKTITDLHQLLTRHGAFRRVRMWTSTLGPEGSITLRAGITMEGSDQLYNLKALSNPEGRLLILVISDCTSRAWYSGAMFRALEQWGNQGIVALVQPFPDWLWDRTFLGMFPRATVKASSPGAVNTRLQYTTRQLHSRLTPQRRLCLPVVTLEPEVLQRWANVVAGQGNATTFGILIDDRSILPTNETEELSAEQLVDRFLSTASSEAIELGGLLTAAAPLTLRIMRLVQQALMPESHQIHLAEVFLSGLLQKVDLALTSSDPEEARFEFVKGIRSLLQTVIPVPTRVQVLDVVGAYIGAKHGLPTDFRSWLRIGADLSTEDERQPFARIAAHELQRLGGAYAELASDLRHGVLSSEEINISGQNPIRISQEHSVGRRVALVVGVNTSFRTQVIAPLHYAENDARAIASILSQPQYNFSLPVPLMVGDHATTYEIKDELLSLTEHLGQEDLLLFYFSGHSVLMTIEGEQEDVYLVTHDFSERQVKRDENFHLSLRWLRDNVLHSTQVGKILLILDCAYAGAIAGEEPDLSLTNFEQLQRRFNSFQGTGMSHDINKARFVLSATGPYGKASERNDHGIFTGVLIEALQGAAVDSTGDVTLGSIHTYLKQKLLDQEPQLYGLGHSQDFSLIHYRAPPKAKDFNPDQDKQTLQQLSNWHQRLEALLLNHSGFMQDRLASFVGRSAELEEIRQRIREKLATGGYVMITGQAGQGKSSVIAQLVQEAGPEQVAHHFIPANPGPDHQVSLLRNLMARLILKYNLSGLYVASESRPALRDYFIKVLSEVAENGGQEVIFIDGLDHLEVDLTGIRDLSFLPTNPPPGIVFVLGTRPNDTLKPLELLKPQHEYRLPNLSRADFDLILEHRGVQLDAALANRFYTSLGENALYLDLGVKELAEASSSDLELIVQRIADNPENLFSITMDRLKRTAQQWREVIKPILGVLLTAREPLSARSIRNIIGLDDETIRDGLQRLGGLLAGDRHGYYSLYHLKLREFLSQDETRPQKRYVFATDEEQGWHQQLANWCVSGIGGITGIWQDVVGNVSEQERRIYARQYYITHLYLAQDWSTLWSIFDSGTYGHAKLRYDPTGRSYAQDLDLGRLAAGSPERSFTDSLSLLTHLWRYSLLRCSLNSMADAYPDSAFEVLVLLGREQEALGLIELLTTPARKMRLFVEIAQLLKAKHSLNIEADQLQQRAIALATDAKASALFTLASALAKAGEFDQALSIVEQMADNYWRTSALSTLALSVWRTGNISDAIRIFERTRALIESMNDDEAHDKALSTLIIALAESSTVRPLPSTLNEILFTAHTIKDSDARAAALGALASSLAQAQRWDEAVQTAQIIDRNQERASALASIAQCLFESKKSEANAVLDQALTSARSIEDQASRADALKDISRVLMKTGSLETALSVVQNVEDPLLQAQQIRWMAAAICESGDYSTSIQMAQTIEEDWIRALSVWDIAAIAARQGNIELAQQLLVEVPVVRQELTEVPDQVNDLIIHAERISQTRQWEQLLRFVQQTWLQAQTREQILQLKRIADGLAPLAPQLNSALDEGTLWVDQYLNNS